MVAPNKSTIIGFLILMCILSESGYGSIGYMHDAWTHRSFDGFVATPWCRWAAMHLHPTTIMIKAVSNNIVHSMRVLEAHPLTS